MLRTLHLQHPRSGIWMENGSIHLGSRLTDIEMKRRYQDVDRGYQFQHWKIFLIFFDERVTIRNLFHAQINSNFMEFFFNHTLVSIRIYQNEWNVSTFNQLECLERLSFILFVPIIIPRLLVSYGRDMN